MKWSLANLRLRELSWDALDLSILENNSQLGTWIQVLFSRRRMKKFSGLTASKCQSAVCPKIHSQGLRFLLYFWDVCLFACFGEILFVFVCCFFCLLCFSLGLLFLLFVWFSLVGCFLLSLGFLWVFFGGWVFYLPYKVICIVHAGFKYPFFLCAPFLFSFRDNISVTFIFYQVIESSPSV